MAGLLSNRKIQFLIVLVALSLFLLFLRDLNPATLDVNLGIEFVGGVRIPVSLEKSVDATTMSAIVDTIKQRVNKFGLSQAVVRPLGDREVIVEIPRSTSAVIRSVETILREQGKFEAVIDSQVALVGDDILGVGGPGAERLPSQVKQKSWEIDFAVRPSANQRFAQVAKGKPNYPVYMFLDRPENAAIIASKARMGLSTSIEGGAALDALQDALRKQGDDIALFFADDFNASSLQKANRSKVVVPESLQKEYPVIFTQVQSLGYSTGANCSLCLVVRSDGDFTPIGAPGAREVGGLSRWPAIGLLSAPTLAPDLAKGEVVSPRYSITGPVQAATLEEANVIAERELKELKTVLTGGRLPVATTIGSAYTVDASLGSKFLLYSFVGAILALVVVAVVVVIRYRKIALVVPIILTDLIEITVLLAVVGAIGTVDLAAMAGIIALVGTGVDDQLIITDEMLRRKAGEEELAVTNTKERLKRAFQIVFTAAGIAIVTMMPLVLSGIVEVVGFGIATILGVLIGVLITRPAYGVLVETLFGQKTA